MNDEALLQLTLALAAGIFLAWAVALSAHVGTLQSAIRRHMNARGHNRCWLNDIELYKVLGEPLPHDPEMPCKREFLGECERYYDLQCGTWFQREDLQ